MLLKNGLKLPAPIRKYGLQALLLSGLLLRLWVYLQNRSLFLDEANLARNIAEQSFSGLFAPLDYQQYAPPLFLVLEKLSWSLAGASEWSLRFWPLIMGVSALYFLYRLMGRTSDSIVPNMLVFWLFAFSQVYIRYATEVKQYSTDMAVATFLIWSALHYSPFERKSHALYWALMGSIAIWLSMPAVFILAGIGAYFLYHYFQKREAGSIWLLLLPALIWLVQFGVYYLLILSRDLQKDALLAYHQRHFWPLLPATMEDWQRMGSLIESLSSTLIGHTFWAILVGMSSLSAGVYLYWKKQKDQLLLLGLPVMFCILASGLGRYSLMERLTLFMMPLLGLLFLYGLQGIWEKAGSWSRLAIVAAFLPILPLRKGPAHLWHPLTNEEMRPLLQELHTVVEPDDRIWVEHNAGPAFIWYSDHADPSANGALPDQVIYNHWSRFAAEELSAQPPSTSGHTWLVFSHLVSEQNLQEMQEHLASMQAVSGPALRELRFPGAAAFEFREMRRR